MNENFDILNNSKSRENMIKFIKNMIVKYKMTDKTFFLTVIYYDIIITSQLFIKHKTNFKEDMIAVACMLLANKFIENDPYVPNLSEILSYSNNFCTYYNHFEIKQYEDLCIKILQYKLDIITAYDYLQILLNFGIILIDERDSIKSSGNCIDNIYSQCLNLLFDIVIYNELLEFSQFHIATACISLIRESLKLEQIWPETFADLYKINFADFSECYEFLKEIRFSFNYCIPVRKKSSNTSIYKTEIKNFLEMKNNSSSVKISPKYSKKEIFNSDSKSKNVTNKTKQAKIDMHLLKKNNFNNNLYDSIYKNGEILKETFYKKNYSQHSTHNSISLNKSEYLNTFTSSNSNLNNFSTFSNFIYKKKSYIENLNSEGKYEKTKNNYNNFNSSKFKNTVTNLISGSNQNSENFYSNCSTSNNSKKSVCDYKDIKSVNFESKISSLKTDPIVRSSNDFTIGKKNNQFNYASLEVLKRYNLMKKSFNQNYKKI